LPPWFKEKYPQIVENLIINRNRLTTHFDLHMTLKHILELSGRSEKLPQALSCPQAQSLFKVVPWNRSCTDACLQFHWCTCTVFDHFDKKDKKVLDAVNYAIDWMNNEHETRARKDDKPLCAHFELDRILVADRSKEIFDENTPNEHIFYLAKFEVLPSWGVYEATVQHFVKNSTFAISGQISRLDEYEGQTKCISDYRIKKFCYCNDLIEK
jgi:hypothetical protein